MRLKRILAVALSAVMVFSAVSCGEKTTNTTTDPTPTTAPSTTGTESGTSGTQGGDSTTTTTTPEPTKAPTEIVTIRFGTHYVQELDPYFTDDVTGEYVMAEAEREARIAGLDAIREELGVEFEFVQYAGNTTEVLLQSVMANDPICDIAWMWGGSEGTVLAQNVLQPLDAYAYIFEDEEYSWMLYDQIFGHYYFLGAPIRFTQRWPLVYNINYIEAVDSLKDENGNTIYPNTLFDEGKWTWSTFQDYLAKIEAYYANSSAPNRPERRIDAYQTDYRFATLSAAYSAGAAIYGTSGLQVNSTEMKEAVAFIQTLKDKKLLTCETYDDSVTPGWTWNGSNFQGGETVFTDIPDWFIGGAVSAAAERGESIGIVPWPRPDDMALDDENYRQVMTVSDSIGILKGVSAEKTELALKALARFYQVYYTTLAGVDTIAEYKDSYATINAAAQGFDIFHEKIGDSILNSYQYIAQKVVGNDYSDLIGMRVVWDEIVGNSLYGVNGAASYDVEIEANMNKFDTIVSDMTAILSSGSVNDNVKPNVTTADSNPLALPVGSSMEDPAWGEYIIAEDNADGRMDISGATFEFNYDVDFTVAGDYNRAFKAHFTDKAGNSNYKTISFILYNPNNTTAPTVTLVAEPAKIAVDTDISTIKWLGSFIESAVDADGLDVSRNIKPDLSTLDTTTPGTYEVAITVTDFAGNVTETTVVVTVE